MTPDKLGEKSLPATGVQGSPVDEAFLVRSVLGGDPAALRELMSRFDRLVRYTVFQAARERCRRDPEWLDSVASATWAGFVQSLNRSPDDLPQSVSAYLVRIARNQTASSLRKKELPVESLDAMDADPGAPDGADDADPLRILSEIEDLTALRACMAGVDGDDRALLAELEAITERRWQDAAAALGLAESTLRSRWKRLLDRLRDCVEGKTGKSFAPEGTGSD